MVESLKELNKICQKPRYKEVGNWMVRHILRDAALPVTWLLLHTSVTADQVTLISLAIGLFGIFLMGFVSKGCFLLGAIFLQIWYLLDHVDGQIARYRGTASLSGRFFDFFTHHLIHGAFFFALGFYASQARHSLFFAVWGFIVSLAMMMFNLLQDTKYKTFFERLQDLKSVKIKTPEASVPAPESGPAAQPGILKRAFSLGHKISEIHVLMNILTLAAFFQAFARHSADFRFVLFLIYGFLVPALAAVKAFYLIHNRKIDEEFESLFE